MGKQLGDALLKIERVLQFSVLARRRIFVDPSVVEATGVRWCLEMEKPLS